MSKRPAGRDEEPANTRRRLEDDEGYSEESSDSSIADSITNQWEQIRDLGGADGRTFTSDKYAGVLYTFIAKPEDGLYRIVVSMNGQTLRAAVSLKRAKIGNIVGDLDTLIGPQMAADAPPPPLASPMPSPPRSPMSVGSVSPPPVPFGIPYEFQGEQKDFAVNVPLHRQDYGYGKPRHKSRMPYKLRKAPGRPLYWVIGEDGKHKSKDPLPKERAEAQMRALYAAENKSGKGNDTLSAMARVAIANNRHKKEDAYYQSLGALPKAPLTEADIERDIKKAEGEMKEKATKIPRGLYPNALLFPSPLSGTFTMPPVEPPTSTRPRRRPQTRKYLAPTDLPPIMAQDYGYGKPRKLKGGGPKTKAQRDAIKAADAEKARVARAKIAEVKAAEAPAVKARTIRAAVVDFVRKYGEPEESSTQRKIGMFHTGIANQHGTRVRAALAPAIRYNPTVRHGDDAREVVGRPRVAPEPEGARGTYAARGRGRSSSSSSSDSDVSIPKNEFVKEHKKLARVLRKGSRASQKSEANDQMRELHKVLKGAGIFDSILKKGKEAFRSVKEKLGLTIRNDYPPKVRKLLAVKGDLPVVSIVARRDPIQSMLNTVLNIASFGQWDKSRKAAAYDNLFHLGLEVSLKPDNASPAVQRLIIEKNAVINISVPSAPTDNTEVCPIVLQEPTTINKLLEGAKKVLANDMFSYDAFKNNCQDFIMAILTGNGLATPESTAFVKQPIEKVASELPSITKTIAKGATDLGAVVDRFTQGAGRANFHLLRGGDVGDAPQNDRDLLTTVYNAKPVDEQAIAKQSAESIGKTLQTAQKGVANTPQQYAKRKKAMELLNANRVSSGMPALVVPTYEDYAADFKNKEGARMSGVDTMNKNIVAEAPKLIEGHVENAKDPEMYSPLNPDATLVKPGVKKQLMRRSEIQNLIMEYNRKWGERNPAGQFFKQLNQALIAIGDAGVSSGIVDKFPFLGPMLSEAYKNFAPPGSKFATGAGKKKREILRRNSQRRE